MRPLNMVQLAQYYDARPVAGLIASEKFDGIRALWTGSIFLTRNGRVIEVPEWFCAGLPNIEIDGELWCGRGSYGLAQGMTKGGANHRGWDSASFMAFDLPTHYGSFTERAAALARIQSTATMHIVDHIRIQSPDDLSAMYDDILEHGGEGVMLRDPDAPYRRERTTELLKLKPSNQWAIDELMAA